MAPPMVTAFRMQRRVYIETYGCQMNVADGEILLGQLARHGFEVAAGPADADVILVNTCAIREHAEERVIGRLRQLLPHKKRSPGVRLGVVGCMAQHYRERLLDRLPFLDLILGPTSTAAPASPRRSRFDDPMVEVRLGREETYADLLPARTPGVRAWVTVMRGCDKFCSFCVVPYVRGRERSLPLDVLLEQVRDAAAEGFREVVLLGQTVNAYRDGDHDFADLLRGVGKVAGIERIRFTSPHPSDMSARTIEAMAGEPKVCPQLHLPLQSASNAVLERMERGYTIEEYDALVRRLRQAIPGLELSTDVIVGFPGETDQDFTATRDYLAATGYGGAFLFAYSAREATKAARWPETVSADEKRRRLAALIALQESISTARNRTWRGREVEVLVEGPASGHRAALRKSAEFKSTVFPSDRHAPGDLVRVRVRDSTAHTLIGEAIESA